MTTEETELLMKGVKDAGTPDISPPSEENSLIAASKDEEGVKYVQLNFRIPAEDKQYWDYVANWLKPLSGNKGFPLLMRAIVKGIGEGWADKLIKPEVYR